MRETNFIKQNKEKWKEFERHLKSNRKDPDKLSNLFVQITDDLSYARTFYPNRSVRVYLNHLAQRVFYSIYRNKKTSRHRFWRFWTDDLPQLMFEARRDLLISFLVFSLSLVIGMVSTANDPTFPEVILSEDYVTMTKENIKNGDPMAVYKGDNELISSFAITQNNLRVAFLTFVSGVFFLIGTIAVLISNGIMVGAFQYFFYQQDAQVFQESLLTIWMHGTLEISAIIIAGAAGMTLGRGLVFPGTYSRMQAFQVSARRGMKMMLGIVPIIITAGFIEGFITRHTEVSDALRICFILLCLFFVLAYYVWYPYRKAKRGFVSGINETKLPPSTEGKINFGRIKSNGEIFTEVFVFYRKHFQLLGRTAFLLSLGYITILLIGTNLAPKTHFLFRNWSIFNINSWEIYLANAGQLFNATTLAWLLGLNSLVFALISYLTLLQLRQSYRISIEPVGFQPTTKWTTHLIPFLKVWMIALIAQFLIQAVVPICLLIWIPLLVLWMVVAVLGDKDIIKSILRSIVLLRGAALQTFGLFFIVALVSILFLFITNSDILQFLLEVIGWNFADRDFANDVFLYGGLLFVFMLSYCLLLPLLIGAYGILYYSLCEISDATSLQERIRWIGMKRNVYGMEVEER